MRYLVFGDVHGNLMALETVLAAGKARDVEAYLFAGDVVGYGPQPLECIAQMVALKTAGTFAWVAGNHELAVRGELDSTGYNEEAIRTLKWTRRLLAEQPAAQEFVKSGATSLQVDELIFLTHDSLAEPTSGHYHREARHAKSELACLRYRKGRVCFYGHTHRLRAELARADGEIVLPLLEAHTGSGTDPHPIRLKENEIGWIGTGSVGLPVNEKRWPEFLILDDSDWRIEKYMVEYDRAAARERTRTILGPACGDDVAEHIARWM